MLAPVRDGLVVAKRNLLKIKRMPDLLVYTIVQPVMFVLLFAYVFGGAISVGGGNYREFLMAGIFTQTVVFGAGITAIGMADDLQKGIVDRFRSLPISRSAVLIGRTTSDLVNNVLVVVVMALCGLLVGWRPHRGVGWTLAAFGVMLLFAYAISWLSATIGLAVSSVEVAQSAGLIWMFPLTFLSNAFVPVETLPGWLRPIAQWNPITSVVSAVRGMFGNTNGQPPLDNFPAQHPILISLLWAAFILAVFVPLAVRKYRTSAR